MPLTLSSSTELYVTQRLADVVVNAPRMISAISIWEDRWMRPLHVMIWWPLFEHVVHRVLTRRPIREHVASREHCYLVA